MKLNQYRLLKGSYSENRQPWHKSDPIGSKLPQTKWSHNGEGEGNVILTTKDLLRHNAPGNTKFQYLGVVEGETEAQIHEEYKQDITLQELHSMTISELKDLAEEHDIRLKGLRKKEDILQLLSNQLELTH